MSQPVSGVFINPSEIQHQPLSRESRRTLGSVLYQTQWPHPLLQTGQIGPQKPRLYRPHQRTGLAFGTRFHILAWKRSSRSELKIMLRVFIRRLQDFPQRRQITSCSPGWNSPNATPARCMAPARLLAASQISSACCPNLIFRNPCNTTLDIIENGLRAAFRTNQCFFTTDAEFPGPPVGAWGSILWGYPAVIPV